MMLDEKVQLSILGLEKGDKKQEEKNSRQEKKGKKYRSQVVIPYVEGVSERFDQVLGKYGVTTAMRSHTTMKRLLVHPKDKVVPEEQSELVYHVRVVAQPT